MKKILLMTLSVCFILNTYADGTKKKSIDSLTVGMKMSEGLINTYSDEENKLYFEISENLLGKDLLVVTRLAQLQVIMLAILMLSQRQLNIVQFEKHTKRILLREVSLQIFLMRKIPFLTVFQ